MTYEIGQKVNTPLGVGQLIDTPLGSGVVEAIGNEIVYVSVCNFPSIPFPDVALKPYRTPHEKLLDMGFEMVLDDEHFMIFEHQKLDYTIRIDKLWKGIGIYHYNDNPNYRYIYLKLSRIITEYLEWLGEEK